MTNLLVVLALVLFIAALVQVMRVIELLSELLEYELVIYVLGSFC